MFNNIVFLLGIALIWETTAQVWIYVKTDHNKYCLSKFAITTELECRKAARDMSLTFAGTWNGRNDYKQCTFADDGRSNVYWNTNSQPCAKPCNSRYASLCKSMGYHYVMVGHNYHKKYCPSKFEIKTELECRKAARDMSFTFAGTWNGRNDYTKCTLNIQKKNKINDRSKVYWNTNSQPSAKPCNSRYASLCKETGTTTVKTYSHCFAAEEATSDFDSQTSGTYCSSRYGNYPSFDNAKNACKRDGSSCMGIYSPRCRKTNYRLCRSSGSWIRSGIGSCVFKKVAGTEATVGFPQINVVTNENAVAMTNDWEMRFVTEAVKECEGCAQCGWNDKDMNGQANLGAGLTIDECMTGCVQMGNLCNYFAYAGKGGHCHTFQTCNKLSTGTTETEWDRYFRTQGHMINEQQEEEIMAECFGEELDDSQIQVESGQEEIINMNNTNEESVGLGFGTSKIKTQENLLDIGYKSIAIFGLGLVAGSGLVALVLKNRKDPMKVSLLMDQEI